MADSTRSGARRSRGAVRYVSRTGDVCPGFLRVSLAILFVLFFLAGDETWERLLKVTKTHNTSVGGDACGDGDVGGSREATTCTLGRVFFFVCRENGVWKEPWCFFFCVYGCSGISVSVWGRGGSGSGGGDLLPFCGWRCACLGAPEGAAYEGRSLVVFDLLTADAILGCPRRARNGGGGFAAVACHLYPGSAT